MSAPQSKQSKPQAAKATPATKEAAPAKAAPAAKAAAPAAAKTAAPAAAKPAAKKAEVTEEHTGGLFDAYDGEPQGAARKASKKPAAAASPVAAGASATEEKSVAFQFSVPNDKVEGKTNPQIKASLNTAFFGWGVIDEIRLVNKEDEKEVTVFLHRPLGKAVAARTAIEKGETSNFNFAGVEAPLSIHEGSSSGGGRSTKTAAGEKKKGADSERGGRGGSRGGRGGRGGASGGSGCFNCGEDGHRAADCPTAGASGSRGGRGGARGGARGGRGGHSE